MAENIAFPESVNNVLKRLEDNGFEAYVVGGAVRDSLSGRPVSDFDVTTNARSDDIKRVFHDADIIETGLKHGTLTVILNGETFEITTFRHDGEYRDARHPENVEFVSSLEEDLKRRDFTINAMAYSERTGLIDLFGGREDLKNGVIRAVGDPEKRFREDALRILRALRFASKLGFCIEKKTLDAAYLLLDNINYLSVERIFCEMNGVLCGKYAYFALHEYPKILFAVIPELAPSYKFDQKNRSHCYDVYEHTLQALKLAAGESIEILWAILLHDAGKPHTVTVDQLGYRHFPDHWTVSSNIANAVLKRLKAPNKLKDEVVFLAMYHDNGFVGGKPVIKRFLRKYGEKYMKDLFIVKNADAHAHSEYGINKYYRFTLEYKELLDGVLSGGECYDLSKLAVNGKDLEKLGCSGKDIGQTLEKLLDLVIEEKIDNDKEILLDHVRKNG